MKAYEEGKEPAKRKSEGPKLKIHLGMATIFGSLVGDKEQTVYWATLDWALSGLFHTWC